MTVPENGGHNGELTGPDNVSRVGSESLAHLDEAHQEALAAVADLDAQLGQAGQTEGEIADLRIRREEVYQAALEAAFTRLQGETSEPSDELPDPQDPQRLIADNNAAILAAAANAPDSGVSQKVADFMAAAAQDPITEPIDAAAVKAAIDGQDEVAPGYGGQRVPEASTDPDIRIETPDELQAKLDRYWQLRAEIQALLNVKIDPADQVQVTQRQQEVGRKFTELRQLRADIPNNALPVEQYYGRESRTKRVLGLAKDMYEQGKSAGRASLDSLSKTTAGAEIDYGGTGHPKWKPDQLKGDVPEPDPNAKPKKSLRDKIKSILDAPAPDYSQIDYGGTGHRDWNSDQLKIDVPKRHQKEKAKDEAESEEARQKRRETPEYKAAEQRAHDFVRELERRRYSLDSDTATLPLENPNDHLMLEALTEIYGANRRIMNVTQVRGPERKIWSVKVAPGAKQRAFGSPNEDWGAFDVYAGRDPETAAAAIKSGRVPTLDIAVVYHYGRKVRVQGKSKESKARKPGHQVLNAVTFMYVKGGVIDGHSNPSDAMKKALERPHTAFPTPHKPDKSLNVGSKLPDRAERPHPVPSDYAEVLEEVKEANAHAHHANLPKEPDHIQPEAEPERVLPSVDQDREPFPQAAPEVVVAQANRFDVEPEPYRSGTRVRQIHEIGPRPPAQLPKVPLQLMPAPAAPEPEPKPERPRPASETDPPRVFVMEPARTDLPAEASASGRHASPEESDVPSVAGGGRHRREEAEAVGAGRHRAENVQPGAHGDLGEASASLYPSLRELGGSDLSPAEPARVEREQAPERGWDAQTGLPEGAVDHVSRRAWKNEAAAGPAPEHRRATREQGSPQVELSVRGMTKAERKEEGRTFSRFSELVHSIDDPKFGVPRAGQLTVAQVRRLAEAAETPEQLEVLRQEINEREQQLKDDHERQRGPRLSEGYATSAEADKDVVLTKSQADRLGVVQDRMQRLRDYERAKARLSPAEKRQLRNYDRTRVTLNPEEQRKAVLAGRQSEMRYEARRDQDRRLVDLHDKDVSEKARAGQDDFGRRTLESEDLDIRQRINRDARSYRGPHVVELTAPEPDVPAKPATAAKTENRTKPERTSFHEPAPERQPVLPRNPEYSYMASPDYLRTFPDNQTRMEVLRDLADDPTTFTELVRRVRQEDEKFFAFSSRDALGELRVKPLSQLEIRKLAKQAQNEDELDSLVSEARQRLVADEKTANKRRTKGRLSKRAQQIIGRRRKQLRVSGLTQDGMVEDSEIESVASPEPLATSSDNNAEGGVVSEEASAAPVPADVSTEAEVDDGGDDGDGLAPEVEAADASRAEAVEPRDDLPSDSEFNHAAADRILGEFRDLLHSTEGDDDEFASGAERLMYEAARNRLIVVEGRDDDLRALPRQNRKEEVPYRESEAFLREVAAIRRQANRRAALQRSITETEQ